MLAHLEGANWLAASLLYGAGLRLLEALQLRVKDVDLAAFKSNVFSMEWPPKSGRLQEFPEVDRASWFSPSAALRKIIKGQRPIVHALIERLGIDPDTDES